MASKNRYWFVKRNQLGIVEDSTGGGQINGVVKKYQNVSGSLNVTMDVIKKQKHFNSTEVPSLSNDWHFEGSSAMDQKPHDIPEQFHEAIIYKAVALGYEIKADFDPNKVQYFEGRYAEAVKKAKAFSRRYYNGGTYRIKVQDF